MPHDTHTDAAAPYPSADNYRDAVAELTRAAHAYYHDADPIMDDAEWDHGVARVAATEAAHPDWAVAHGLLSDIAAGTPSAGDVAHDPPMLSLAKTTEPVADWVAAARDNGLTGAVVVEPKLDGVAIAVRYRDGQRHLVLTRGDGHTGEDVTANLADDHIDGLPAQLSGPLADATVEVRGELHLTYDQFDAATAARTDAGHAPFANPRNAAAGLLANGDRPAAHLSFAAYSLTGDHPRLRTLTTHTDAMRALADSGVATAASHSPATSAPLRHGDDVAAAVDTIGDARARLPYGIDGAVVKADDLRDRGTLGDGSRHPRWAVAVKYPPVERRTTLHGIHVDVGRTGTLGFRADLAPVDIDGSTVTSATLHNPSEILRKDLRVGDTVMVHKAGDVIPQVLGVVAAHRPADAAPWQPPHHCPRCGGDLDTSEKRWRCRRGRDCGRVELLAYSASRDALDIDGLGRETVTQLVDRALVADLADLYDLTVVDIAALDGHGATSAANLVAAIDASRAQPPHRLLTALGVDSTGRRLSHRLVDTFGSVEAVRDASAADLAAVDGVGDVKAARIHADLADLTDLIDRLAARGVARPTTRTADTDTAAPTDTSGPLPLTRDDGSPQRVAITGKLATMTRRDARDLVETLGGRVATDVTSQTDAVVAGDDAGRKLAKARKLRIPVLTSDDLAALADRHTRHA